MDDPFVFAPAVLFVFEVFGMRLGIVTGSFDVDANVRRKALVGLTADGLDMDDDDEKEDDDTLVFVRAVVVLLFNEVVVRLAVESDVFDVEANGRRMVWVEWVVDDGKDEPFTGLEAESVRAFTRRFSSSVPLRLMPTGIFDRVMLVRG